MTQLIKHTAFKTNKHLTQTIFVLVVILLAIWQIALFRYTLKWDAVDITLPWRYFVSDAIYSNGILPWWNPFQHHGFAQGLSLETWYPIAHLLGFLRPYDLYSLNLEYILHLLIASYGFYRLARVLGIHHQGSLWGAIVFPLSGFFLSNSQHTGWIASGAWIPHILATFMYWLDQHSLKNSVSLILLSFLLVSGGYIAYSIITLYLMGFIWAYNLLSRRRARKDIKSFLWMSARLVLWTILGLSLLIVALATLKNQIDRGTGLSGDALVKGTLYLKHLISFILPYATLKGSFEFWKGDQALMNVYIGIPSIILLILSTKKLDQSFYRFWWSIALASLALALAVELPFRRWINILPMFDLFRFPSLFRYFTILALTLIAAKMIGDHPYRNDDASRLRKLFLKIAFGLLAVLIATICILVLRKPNIINQIIHLKMESISAAMAFQCMLHCVLLIFFIGSARLLINRLDFFKLLLVYTALDLILAFQVNARVSLLSEYPLSQMQHCIDQLPQGYPAPPSSDLIGSNSDGSLHTGAIYRNTNTLYKRIGWNGYTPYQYQRYVEFEKTDYFPKALALPAVFLSRSLVKPDSLDFYISEPIINMGSDRLRVLDYSPNFIKIFVDLPSASGLVFNQNFARGWKAKLDGQPVSLHKIDHSLMGITVPDKRHEVEFYYDPGNLLNAWGISVVTMILFGLLYFWFNRHGRAYQLALVFIAFLLLVKCYLVFKISKPLLTPDSRSIVNQLDEIDFANDKAYFSDRFLDRGDLERFHQSIYNFSGIFNYYDRELCLPQMHLFTDMLTKDYQFRKEKNEGIYQVWQGKSKLDSIVFTMWNGFEAPVARWHDQGVSIRLENNNQYQALDGRNYSASFQLDLDEIDWREVSEVIIEMDHRNTEPIQSSLIFTLQDENHQDLVWRSQVLPEHQVNPPTWRHKVWKQKNEVDWKDAKYLNVYIWNKDETALEIDNILLTLLRPGNDI